MVREPGNRPAPSNSRTELGPAMEPAVSTQLQKVKIALATGAVLLLAGTGLFAFAMLKPSGDTATEESATINLTAAGSSPGSTLTVMSTPTAAPTGKAKKQTASTPTAPATTPAAKPTKPPKKPKSKSTPKKAAAVKAAPNTAYLLRNGVTGNCVSTMVLNVATTQEACGGVGKVQLEPTRAVNGVQLYRIREGGGANLCLDVPNTGSEAAGTAIGAVDCINPSSSDNQEWQLKNSGRTSQGRVLYFLVNFASGNCLDVFGSASDQSDRNTGLALTIATCAQDGGYDDHYWTFS